MSHLPPGYPTGSSVPPPGYPGSPAYPGYPAGGYPAGAVPSYPAGAVPSYPAGAYPSMAGRAAYAVQEQGTMQPGQRLMPGQSIYSDDGSCFLTMQDDGNLVLYRTRDRNPMWSSNTQNRPVAECVMQEDGNLVLYDHSKGAHWSTNTHGKHGASLKVQGDGNMCIYHRGNAVWATGSNGKNR